MDVRSQCNQILEYMKKGFGITGIEALDMFGCFRLPARISDLKRRGYLIKRDIVKTKSGKRVARYSLETLES